MSEVHLWEAKHPYYCEEGQYFSSQSSSQTIWPFKSWADFIEEMGDADMDYNMLFRWDWLEPEEDEDGEPIPAFNGGAVDTGGVMSDCYCDYDMPSVYVQTKPKARKEHRCNECGSKIEAGQQYERTFGVWDGRADHIKTCLRCVDMRDFVKAHVPCFCWSHHNLHEDCIEMAREWSHEAPGLLFGTYRRSIRRIGKEAQ